MCDLTLMSNRTTKVQIFIRIQQQIRALFLANFSYYTHRQKCAKTTLVHMARIALRLVSV